uniref:Saposin B-type domain-containing protein n=1 Tax=Plectus sambesii TaxID=2011161 RepID=A0A914V5K2_9BILA
MPSRSNLLFSAVLLFALLTAADARRSRFAFKEISCAICNDVVYFLEQNSGITEHALEEIADHLCDKYSVMASQCRVIVNHSLHDIFMAFHNMPPSQVCHAVGMC